jgi:hypothetical protein
LVAADDLTRLEITIHVPAVNDEPKRVRELYREAWAHRRTFILDSPTPQVYERQLEEMAKAWINSTPRRSTPSR